MVGLVHPGLVCFACAIRESLSNANAHISNFWCPFALYLVLNYVLLLMLLSDPVEGEEGDNSWIRKLGRVGEAPILPA